MKKVIESRLKKKYLVQKPIFFGLIGSLILLSLYFLVLILANSPQHAIQEFARMWYWILFLVIGFGIQIGLYTYIRSYIKLKSILGIKGNIAATGSVSTASMLACCAHHLSDILPIIGLSAAAIFFNKYQILFIIIGLLSNIMGIVYMLRIIQKHNLYEEDGLTKKLMTANFQTIFYYTLSLSVIIFIIALLIIRRN
ncbi:hypothetical protein J4455_02085 [Candidatus Woesearchaeota archaeon]|nr:hypothetical protein [Candidatus Woesearchaeota archaeon]